MSYLDARRAVRLARLLERERGPEWADQFWKRIERAKGLAEHRVLCNTAEEQLASWHPSGGAYQL